jgi:glycosyltransferase involved in cell wall biosynthesis
MSPRRLAVLIVSAQFPFPPRTGFARRVDALARTLARRHEVTVLSYARAGEAARDEERRVRVVTVERTAPSTLAKRAGQLASLASRHPYACRAVHSGEMQRAIDALCAYERFDVVQLEASVLCAFAVPAGPALVLDEHNIEYEVLARMQEGERSPLRRAFNRLELRRFRSFEEAWLRRVDGCVVTSPREARIVRAHAPATPAAIVPNGVDLDRFAPGAEPAEPRTLVFNGILDYRPNVDAALHLVDEVWPLVRRACPDARLAIVGRGSDADRRRLARPGVEVLGEVEDVRVPIRRAAVSAVPIRMGGGTRLKVVEGLAMARPMVSTTRGCEGIAVRDGEHLLIADGAEAFAAAVVRLFEDPALGAALGAAGRALMEREYSWELAGERLEELYAHVVPVRSARTTFAGGPHA